MTLEELKIEAEKLGYSLHKSQKGCHTCAIGREAQLKNGRKLCERYEFAYISKNGVTHCVIKEQKND